MSSNDRQRALERIKKLLQMAKDGRGNANEAEIAMRQAQALMTKFNIDEAEAILADLKGSKEAIVSHWRKAGVNANATNTIYKFPEWASILSYGVGKLYDCRTMISWVKADGVTHGKCVVFAGYETDVQVACWTFDYLMDSIKRACTNFEEAVRTSKVDSMGKLREFGVDSIHEYLDLIILTPKARKDTFRHTMACMLQQRMLGMRRERDESLKKPGNPTGSLALVVVDAKQQALDEQYGAEEVGDIKKKRVGNPAELAGAIAGNKVRLDQAVLQGEGAQQRAALPGGKT